VTLYDPRASIRTTRKKTKMPDAVEIAVRLRCFVRSEGVKFRISF
jgi:hypothetical protein